MVYNGSDGQYATRASGVLIDYDEVLTCWHCVDEGTTYAIEYNGIDERYSCTLADSAESEDAAVLTPPYTTVKPAKLGDSDDVEEGDTVYVISCPHGEKNTVTSGTVEFVPNEYGGDITVSLLSASGSSGGACFNTKGELIGIVQGVCEQG
jgi:serine protease Do